ncbi:MAG: hypothetical protein ACKOBW_09580, partial [Planctomycetota bacterium]
VDYVERWAERAELPAKRLLGWLELSTSKFHQWKDRYGKANEHNGKIPRDWWLENWEKQAILDYHERHPLEGYVDHYNHARLHSAIEYLTPADKLNDMGPMILEQRDQKLEEARARRQQNRAAAKAVA